MTIFIKTPGRRFELLNAYAQQVFSFEFPVFSFESDAAKHGTESSKLETPSNLPPYRTRRPQQDKTRREASLSFLSTFLIPPIYEGNREITE